MRAVAVLFAVFWGFFFFGLIDLLVFLQGPEFLPSFQLETGWGLFFLIIVAVPLLAIAVIPDAVLPAALQQVSAAGVAIAIGAGLSGSPEHVIPAAGVAATALTVAAVGRVRIPLPSLRRWSWAPGALVVASAGPCAAYALMSAGAAREGLRADETWGLDHWPIQAALAVGVVLLGALATTRPRGWFLPTWCVGMCATWFGVASWRYPDVDASLGRPWGAAAIVWGLAFVATTHLAATRTVAP